VLLSVTPEIGRCYAVKNNPTDQKYRLNMV